MTRGRHPFGAPAIAVDIIPFEIRARYRELRSAGKARFMGIGLSGRRTYDCPKYDITADEKVIQNGNSFVVLGYDRPHSRGSGFGGKGNTRCSSIDIVVGRLGYQAASHQESGTENIVNPNFKKDAARIYMSQKSAVDDVRYFGLPRGTVGNVKMRSPRSTIALKADTLRFIARENIKLVTRTDKKNSQGGRDSNAYGGQYGIDLIAMNDDRDMQPLVKGTNLVLCLTDMTKAINELRDKMLTMMDYQRNLSQAILTHTHMSWGVSPNDTSPDFKSIMPKGIESELNKVFNVEIPMMIQDPMEAVFGETTYLTQPGGMADRYDRYILSKYNNTN